MVNLQVMEALVDRLVTYLERPDVESMGNQYGVVSTFFCHSLYAVTPDFPHLYTSFIQKHVAARKNVLLIPLVRHDHWHVAEVRLDEDVVKHYSSAGHSAYVEPVNKVIAFMDHMKSGFDPNNIWRKFRYEAVPCEQQTGIFDCGLFVPLYIKAIIHGVDTTQVTNHSDESEVIRARLAAELLIEGWEQKNQGETVEKDG
ncbi:uncharacterized protein LOC109828307 [Asparagus officinalis]|uniref:uncharacterized protein LOC109828307 n=2 Tax=Asparagus officinalis TaxID=4686 RepID=UPI00098E1EDE|nr:uncharacterized protein LOC109828307 [Asparagus officinalis]XP_020250920.1 uncharacterized protein LOC109828307 [Asparagus officinalis]